MLFKHLMFIWECYLSINLRVRIIKWIIISIIVQCTKINFYLDIFNNNLIFNFRQIFGYWYKSHFLSSPFLYLMCVKHTLWEIGCFHKAEAKYNRISHYTEQCCMHVIWYLYISNQYGINAHTHHDKKSLECQCE